MWIANSMWTVNFQMLKLVLEKAEGPEFGLPTSAGSSKKQESFRKTSTFALLITPKTLCGTQQTVEYSERDGKAELLTYLLRNLYEGQKATVRTWYETTDCFQFGKGVHQGSILSPCLYYFYAEYIMRNAGLDEAQAGIKIAGRNMNNLRYAHGTTLMAAKKN